MVSVKSFYTVFEFMVTTGIAIQISFLTKTLYTLLSKIKMEKDIRVRDQQHVQVLQDKGYTVEIIWEKDWEALLAQRPEIKAYISQHHTCTHFKKYLNQDQVIQYIQDGRCFGFIECDIEVPDQLKEYFSQMTPIFKNVDVCLNDVGDVRVFQTA